MSYYMGDMYYGPGGGWMPGRGDPGFFSFLGGLAKSAVGLIPGVGPIAARAMTTIERVTPAGMRGVAGSAMRKAGGVIMKHPVLSGAAAAGAVAAAGAGVERMMMGGGACPKGFHPCKSRHGCRRGACVRNRKMNVCNPRALRRASRRAHGFLRLSSHIVRYYTGREKKGKAYIGRPRRKK